MVIFSHQYAEVMLDVDKSVIILEIVISSAESIDISPHVQYSAAKLGHSKVLSGWLRSLRDASPLSCSNV